MDRLKQYREQREAIRRHLQWLDDEIARFERDAQPGIDAPKTEGHEPVASEVAEAAKEPSAQPVATAKEEAVTEAPDVAALEETFRKYQSTQTSLMRTKLGCSLIIIGMIALFLFLLFGLPYLLF